MCLNGLSSLSLLSSSLSVSFFPTLVFVLFCACFLGGGLALSLQNEYLLEGELTLEGELGSLGLLEGDLGTSDPRAALAVVGPGHIKVLKGVKGGLELGTIAEEVGPLVGQVATLNGEGRGDRVGIVDLVVQGELAILVGARELEDRVGLAGLDVLGNLELEVLGGGVPGRDEGELAVAPKGEALGSLHALKQVRRIDGGLQVVARTGQGGGQGSDLGREAVAGIEGKVALWV